MPNYEVRCHRCDVSFPPETKRCMHCGERTSGAPRKRGPERFAAFQQLLEREEPEPAYGQPQPIPIDIEDEETPTRRRSFPKAIGSLVWIFLLIGVSIYRGCTGG